MAERSRIKSVSVEAKLVAFDAETMTSGQLFLPNIEVTLTGVVDGVFLEKLVKFVEDEINYKSELDH